jgi:thioredoxin:protein disulfide reductase
MFKPIALLNIAVLLVALSACSHNADGPTSSSSPAPSESTKKPASSVNFVRVHAAEVQLQAGGSATAEVLVSIQSGYHINANPPTYPYLKATELTVQTGDGVSVGFITYPTPMTKKFSFADKPLAVYEGDAEIKVMLKTASMTLKGVRMLPAKLNVQACDDQVCYPPGAIDLSLPVTIK